MKYMLDTNIISYLMKNSPISVAKKINSLPASTSLMMSYVTYAELLKGAENSLHKVAILQKIEKMTQTIEVVYPKNALICEHYAINFLRLKANGTQIGNNDLWIGCHALAENTIIVTNNVKEFERIATLKIENWL